MLAALARFESMGANDVPEQTLAVFSGQSPISSAYKGHVSDLIEMDYMREISKDRYTITDDGRARANAPTPIHSVDELHQAWFNYLNDARQVTILKVLIEHRGEILTREQLAELSGQRITSSEFGANLRVLSGLGIINYPQSGQVTATDLLFPNL
jgi:hypothetical protein